VIAEIEANTTDRASGKLRRALWNDYVSQPDAYSEGAVFGKRRGVKKDDWIAYLPETCKEVAKQVGVKVETAMRELRAEGILQIAPSAPTKLQKPVHVGGTKAKMYVLLDLEEVTPAEGNRPLNFGGEAS
jgi:hypothetical protein